MRKTASLDFVQLKDAAGKVIAKVDASWGWSQSSTSPERSRPLHLAIWKKQFQSFRDGDRTGGAARRSLVGRAYWNATTFSAPADATAGSVAVGQTTRPAVLVHVYHGLPLLS
jgi:hypothetical protein